MAWRVGRYQVLGEIAREIIYFSAADGEIPETGVDLKINQLAAT